MALPNKTRDDSLAGAFGSVGYAGDKLREMADCDVVMAVVIDAAKKQGVRFDVFDFPDGEIERFDKNVVIFRGSAAKFIDGLFEGLKRRNAGEP